MRQLRWRDFLLLASWFFLCCSLRACASLVCLDFLANDGCRAVFSSPSSAHFICLFFLFVVHFIFFLSRFVLLSIPLCLVSSLSFSSFAFPSPLARSLSCLLPLLLFFSLHLSCSYSPCSFCVFSISLFLYFLTSSVPQLLFLFFLP